MVGDSVGEAGFATSVFVVDFGERVVGVVGGERGVVDGVLFMQLRISLRWLLTVLSRDFTFVEMLLTSVLMVATEFSREVTRLSRVFKSSVRFWAGGLVEIPLTVLLWDSCGVLVVEVVRHAAGANFSSLEMLLRKFWALFRVSMLVIE